MKLSFIFFALLLNLGVLSAQNTIAKLKYEEAEEAYNKKEYSTVVAKLDEAEKMLGKSNPKIMYLRILSDSKILESNPYDSFNQIAKLRQNCDYYLKNYDTEGLEEKYKEIYKTSESLKSYPVSAADFDAQKNELLKKEKAKKAEEQLLASLISFADSICTAVQFRKGMTQRELLQANSKLASFKMYDMSEYYRAPVFTYSSKSLSINAGFEPRSCSYWINNKSDVIYYNYVLEGGKGDDARAKAYEKYQLLKKLSAPFTGRRFYAESKQTDQYNTSEQFTIGVPVSPETTDDTSYIMTIIFQVFKNRLTRTFVEINTKDMLLKLQNLKNQK